MGQQQLLLIVLGVIIIGIAVLLGITLFRAHSIETKKESVINDCAHIGTLAQKHYWTPREMGGGGNTFDGSNGSNRFEIPLDFQPTANGTYEISDWQPREITITATSSDLIVNEDIVSVTMKILPKDFQILEVTPE